VPARFKAFSVHFLISLLLAFASLLWVFKVWYPAPLHNALAVTHIFILLVAVDVTLGPILTAIVYKPGKATLAFDLTVIAVLQLVALTYGLWAVSEGRPAWLVFNVDRFDVVQVKDIDLRHQDLAAREYQTPSWFGPRWVGADRSAVSGQGDEIIFEAILGGPDIAQRPFLYRPLGEFSQAMRRRAQPIERLEQFNGEDKVATIMAEWPFASGWLPLMASARPMVVLLGEDNTKVLSVLPLKPWE